jgi:3-methyladenine DNA glycosylase AlkD
VDARYFRDTIPIPTERDRPIVTEKETLKTLKSMGTAQNRKIYKRHGVDGEIYGVSYANLKELKKKIKIDNEASGTAGETRRQGLR